MGDTKNIASNIRTLKSFDGKGSYREWVSDTLIMTSLTHKDVYKVMQGGTNTRLASCGIYREPTTTRS